MDSDARNDAQAMLTEMRRAVLRRARPGDTDSIGRLRRLVARLNPEQYVTVRVDDLMALLRQAEHEETQTFDARDAAQEAGQ